MIQHKVTTPVALIFFLDKANEEKPGEAVRLIFGEGNIDYVDSIGFYDILFSYRKLMDINIDVFYSIDFMTLAAICGADMEKVRISKSAFVIFSQPSITIFGSMSDLRIYKEAFENLIMNNAIVIATKLGLEATLVRKWIEEGRIVLKDELNGYGFKTLGE